MICSMCNKNQASIFSSKITPDGKREMEGLCINCAKKLGINTDEILKAQNQTIINNQSEQMNKQLEGLFKNLSENLGSIDGIELGAIPINEEDDVQDDENETPRVFAGAIPLGSLFGNIFGGPEAQTQQASNGNGNIKKKVKPEKKKNKKKKFLDTYGTNLTFKAQNNELDIVIGRDKELQRVNKKILETLNSKDVIFRFPNMYDNNSTTLILKTPKTKTSVRKVFIPRTVVEMLKKRKEQIEEMKKLYGAEYTDYNLVFTHSNGRPLEGSYIRNALNKLIKDNDLPPIVFHSFRHASITYKLKWNGGDMKSVQGDSGHAQLDMITDVYSHIIDEDRRYNAQRFEEQFYNTKGLNLKENKEVPVPEFNALVENVKKSAYKEKVDDKQSEQELLTKLLNNPETAALLKLLAKNM